MFGTRKNRVSGAISLIAVCGSALLLLFGAGSASARSLPTHTLITTFNTPDLVDSIAVDEVSGAIYTVNDYAPRVRKFHPDGTPWPFTAPELGGASILTPEPTFGQFQNSTAIAVDNSATATQGRIYVMGELNEEAFNPEAIWAFEASGKQINGKKFPITNAQLTPPQSAFTDVSVNPTSAHLWISDVIYPTILHEFNTDGEQLSRLNNITTGRLATDSGGNFYVSSTPNGGNQKLAKLNPDGELLYQMGTESIFDVEVNASNDDVYAVGGLGNEARIRQYDSSGNRVSQFFDTPNDSNPRAVAVDPATEKLFLASGNQISVYGPGAAITIPDLSIGAASEIEQTSVTLNGAVNPDGVPTTYCKFTWGVSVAYGNTDSCAQGEALVGSGDQQVSVDLSGLLQGTTYHFALVVKNAQGEVVSADGTFRPSVAPISDKAYVSDVHADSAVVHASVNPGGAETTYRIEYGKADCSANPCQSTASLSAGANVAFGINDVKIDGLEDGTVYHYRIVGENQSGPFEGADHVFKTFDIEGLSKDFCANAHVRQQTGSALLTECRAYELVSAGDTSGYDVESDLTPGQVPFDGYPDAVDRALYAIHSGAISGVGSPANHGPDSYVATRGESGWSTQYVGIPSDNEFATAPFASSLLEADSSLTTFAFGGPDICSPCFGDGSTNVPLRLADGSLVKGMVGSEDPGPANPAGHVAKRFSGDREHFVFGTTTKLEPTANSGVVTLYERDLKAGTTEVVSTLPNGSTMTGNVGELDVSFDGSRVIVAQEGPVDPEGNVHWHPYMHFAGSAASLDLAPGSVTGVLFAGMTSDGARAFFTTEDKLLVADADTSADLYEAAVDQAGALTLSLVSTGATPPAGNSDACLPPDAWNNPTGSADCGVLAIAGGGGVASDAGTIYFLSPELLDASAEADGVQGEPNIYVVEPGDAPQFVATIESSVGKPLPPNANHPVENENLISGLNKPEGLAVDQTTGDIYVAEIGSNLVSRYTAAGVPHDFPAIGPTNELPNNFYAEENLNSQIAIDNSGGPLDGTLYALRYLEIRMYSRSGAEIGRLDKFSTSSFPCGVAVDQTSGALYLGDINVFNAENEFGMRRMTLKPGATAPYDNSDFNETALVAGYPPPCQVAADGVGNVFGQEIPSGSLRRFSAGDFAATPPFEEGTQVFGGSKSPSVDSVQHDLYVNAGDRILRFDSGGALLQEFGAGSIGSSSLALAVNGITKQVYATKGGSVVAFGIEPYENRAVLNALEQAETRSYGDFQVTPDGAFAAFPSGRSLVDYENRGNMEVYRYEPASDTIVCASCNPTGAVAETGASLAGYGLSLLEDGRVFFNSDDGIAARDLNEKRDAYQYSSGDISLISTGTSAFNSSLLGASRDGTDVFFFTRDTLVPEDTNGSLVKLYDARVGGGYPYVPPAIPCKASDECHGAGSPPPPPLGIRTLRGSVGNHPASKKRCKRGRVRKKNGRCVRRKHPRRTHRHG